MDLKESGVRSAIVVEQGTPDDIDSVAELGSSGSRSESESPSERMLRFSHMIIAPLAVLVLGLVGDDDSPKRDLVAEARAVFEAVRRDRSGDSRKDRTRRAFEEHADVLEEGDGLHYRLRLAVAAGLPDEAIWSFERHLELGKKPALKSRSRVYVVSVLSITDPDRAIEVWDDIDVSVLDFETRAIRQMAEKHVDAVRRAKELIGKDPPLLEGVNSPAQTDVDVGTLARAKGQPVVVLFWSWWCGGCKPLMSGLERARERGEHDALLVYPTKLYGNVAVDGEHLEGVPPYQETIIVRSLAKEVGDRVEPVFVTAETEASWGVLGYATVVIVDRDGRTAKHIVGAEFDRVLSEIQALDGMMSEQDG